MALQGSGQISISNIAVELGRAATAQTDMNESAVRTLAGVASGAISMSNFYGKSTNFVFNQTLSSNTTDYNLKSSAIAGGWNQTAPLQATITINSGVYVYATSTGTYAFDTGSTFPSGTTLALVNNGVILGAGGAGGGGGQSTASASLPVAGAGGGPALIARYAISITNNNTIGGGGGGGGGGGATATNTA